MADELAVVVKTKLEIDEQQFRRDADRLGENSKAIKVPVEADKSTFDSSIDTLRKNPPVINLKVDADSIVKTIRDKLNSAKFSIKVDSNAIAKAATEAAETASKKASKAASSIIGVDPKEIAGSQKYVDKLVEKANQFKQSFADASAKIADTQIVYKPLEKLYQASVRYEDSIGRTTSMVFSLNEGMEEVQVTQLRLTDNEKKYRAEVEKTQKIVSDYQTKLANLRSKAFSQKNPIPEQYAGDLNGTFTQIEATLDGIGDSVASETKIILDRLLSEADTKIKEIRSKITTSTDLRAKDVTSRKAFEENKLDTFVTRMENAGTYTEEMQQRVSWLRQELSTVNDSVSMNAYLDDLNEAESRLKTIQEEMRGLRRDYRDIFDQAISEDDRRVAYNASREASSHEYWQNRFSESIPGPRRNDQLNQLRDQYLREEAEAQVAYRQMFDDIQRANDTEENLRQTEYRALFDRAQREQAEIERIAQAEREIAQINERRDADSHAYWQREFMRSVQGMTASDPDSARTSALYRQEQVEAERVYKDMVDQAKAMSKLGSQKGTLGFDLDSQISDLKEMGLESSTVVNKLIELKDRLENVNDEESFSALTADLKQAKIEIDTLLSSTNGQLYQTALGIGDGQLDQIRKYLNYDAISSDQTDGIVRLRKELQELKAQYESIQATFATPLKDGTALDPADIQKYNDELAIADQRLASAARQAKLFNGSIASDDAVAKANMQIEKLKNNLDTLEIDWSKALEIPELKADINAMRAALENADAANLPNLQKAFTELRSKIQAAGADCKSFGARMAEAFSKVKDYFSIAEILQYIKEGVSEVAQAVKEVDTAMTELRKVTNLSESGYDQFTKEAASRAKEIGTSVSDYINSTADFSRLGFGFEDADTMAYAANIYYKVGDQIGSIEEATQSLVSTTQAYGLTANDALTIVDKLNSAGNSLAISSGGLGAALQKSAAALAAGNNTLDESIALIAAANRVAQNPEAVGNMWKTVSMRIRSAKVELEDAGEDTDGLVESTAELQAMIKGMTGFDILEADQKTFKSTYDIIVGIAKEWKSLEDIEQANMCLCA